LLLSLAFGAITMVWAENTKKSTNTFFSPIFEQNYQEIDSPEVDLRYPIVDPIDPSVEGKSNIDFEDPSNVETKVEYNPETGNYEFQKKIGDFRYKNPIYMTPDEYQDFNDKKAINDYWKEMITKDNPSSTEKEPTFGDDIKKKAFGNLFGNDIIDIRPQGTAEISLGINSSKTENPQIPERRRRLTTFDFQERIQLNVLGKIGDKLQTSINYNTEATFDFENQMKLEFEGDEDQIVQKIEA